MNTNGATPFTESEVTAMVAHMNEDHADSILAYLHHFGNLPEATGGRLLDITSRAMRIEATTPCGRREVTIPFAHSLASTHDAHRTMVQMSKQAKRALGR